MVDAAPDPLAGLPALAPTTEEALPGSRDAAADLLVLNLRRIKLAGLLFAATFILVVAVRLNISEMYLMAGTLLSMLPVAYGLGWASVRGATVARDAPDSCFEGDLVRISLSVSRQGYLARGLISLAEGLPPGFEREPSRFSDNVPAAAPAMASGLRPASRLDTASAGDHGSPTIAVATLGATVEEVVPRKRGVFQWGPVSVVSSDPLGLFAFRRRLPIYAPITVYPRPQPPPDRRPAPARQRGSESSFAGGHRGDSVDLHGTREYREGDELRRIHWPSTARLGRLVVVEREDPANRSQVLALDLRHRTVLDPGRDSSLDVAARTAAWLAREALSRGDAVGLLANGDAGLFLAPARGESHYLKILERLARAEASAGRGLGECLAKHRRAIAGGRLAIFTSMPDSPLLAALRAWLRSGGEASVYLFGPDWPGAGQGEWPAPEFAALLRAEGMPAVLLPRPQRRL